jgi:mono/diheme cytochrome c family protein
MSGRLLPPLLVAVALFAPTRATPDEPAPPPRPPGHALLKTYCFECHSGGTKRGGLALDQLLAADPAEKRGEWEKVWKTVRHEFMPPAHADRPTAKERTDIARWVERTVFRADESDPGRVTIRRLNRMEYQFTVQDLFGIDLELAQDLPPDDTAFGFDNIGDAQTVSPALLDTYLTLAEKVVAAALVTDGPRHPQLKLRPSDFQPAKADAPGRARQAARFDVKYAGKYRVEVQFSLGGWQEFGGEYGLAVALGGKAVGEAMTVKVGGNRTYTVSGELELPKGANDLVVTTDAFGKAKAMPVSPRVSLTGPLGTDIFEYPASHERVFFKGTAPAEPAARRAYARELLARVAGRAFRRPAADATLDKLTDMALAAPTFEAGVGQAITAILTSPRFFFRAELQPRPDEPKEVHPLGEYALASRLSYLLWLSVPDDELIGLAAAGKLRANLEPQLRRMLVDPKSNRFFEDFGGQWLRTRNVLLTPVTFRDMGAIDPLRPLMKRETDMLFEHVARTDRDLTELLTADYTFLNDRLAAHYGIKGVTGGEFRKVPLPADGRRAGILTHAGVLLATSNPNRTSPVKRGLFVLENLFGREVPPPPPDVGNLEDVKGEKPLKTLREQLAAHREKKACAACHAHFDPIGLALENYDTAGRWRDRDNREPIDAKVELVTGEAITGAVDLGRVLAARKDVFYRCVTEKLLTYALGRGLDPADAMTVDRIAEKVAAGGGKFGVLLTEIVNSTPFQKRRGDGGETRTFTKPAPEKRKLAAHESDPDKRKQKEKP